MSLFLPGFERTRARVFVSDGGGLYREQGSSRGAKKAYQISLMSGDLVCLVAFGASRRSGPL